MMKTSKSLAQTYRTRGLLPAVFAVLLALIPDLVYSAGFQIPNQSLKAIGNAGANIAYTPGPDAAYYNPANMSFLTDEHQFELSLTTLWLPEITYTDNRSPALDGESDFEIFYLPQLHWVSKEYSDFRFGFSLTYPYGLAKHWDQPFPAASTEKFSLTVVEASPSVAYQVNDKLSLGGGLRLIYAEGETRSNATNPPIGAIAPLSSLGRNVDDADDIGFGYNLAATYKPTKEWRLAATFRSGVDLELDGEGTLSSTIGGFPLPGYSGSADLDITLPPVLSLATSYTFGDLTLEVAWSRTFWSEMDELDFQYSQDLTSTPYRLFDVPVEKDWDDSDALRFGLTYAISKQWTTMAGFAIDETPIPDETLNFELPDADAFMYGLGVLYAPNETVQLGLSYMYYHVTSRSVTSSTTGLDGEFDDGGAHAITVGIITRL